MDYKKKLKDALDDKLVPVEVQDWIEENFPELVESEDDRIRKGLIEACKKSLIVGGFHKDKVIAWLEKQAEQKSAEISNVCEFSIETWIKIVDFVLTEHDGIGNYLINPEVKDTAEKLQKKYKFDAASEEWDRVYRKGLDAGINKGRAEAIREQNPANSKNIDLDELVIELEETIGTSPHSRETIKDFFQKAVQKYMKCLQIANGEIGRLMDENYYLKEQKPTDNIPQDFEKYVEHLLSLSDGEGHSSPAKVKEVSTELFKLAQLEKKPADKVEPKFKVGDWIIDNNIKTPFLITGISNEKYDVISIYGTDMAFSFHEVEHFYHLWTIQDAKAGDVLAVEPIEGYLSSFVAIYKKQNEEDFDSYCFVGFNGKFYDGENGHSAENIHPATQEQRDALMKAMSDAGYTFDFEKNELKKIEKEDNDEDSYCKKNCKGYRDTGGLCFCDGRCEAYRNYQKEKSLRKT